MIPHAYSLDSQSLAQELASTVLSASSPPKIAAACAAIETFIQKHNADNSRWFFSIAFPALICKIFGFDESSSQKSPSTSNGWIDQIHALNDSELAGRVFNLLSPSGVLMSSISAVDRHMLVKYVFPVERLPEWVRFMLQNERDCRVLSDLCPLFKGRIKEDQVKGCYQVQLNVFEYYMFWFAYYPVCKGNSDNSDTVVVRKSRKFMLENWTSSFPVFSGATRGVGQKADCNLYDRLFYAYLRANVPHYGSNAHQPYRSSLLHYSSGYDGSIVLRAEFLVHTFINFWLVDNDFSPVSVNVCRSFGATFPFRTVLGETPPTSGLGEVVKLFVKYINSGLVAIKEVSDPVDYVGSPWRRASGSADVLKSKAASSASHFESSIGTWNSLIQRPLYRFILRAFLFCPIETSIKNASQVFSLWINYMEPWKISLDDFLELDSVVDQSTVNSRTENTQSPVTNDTGKDGRQLMAEYTNLWQGYVLSNYLFYSSLVMHFLGFAHKFLHTDVETIIQMVLKVFSILTSSRELMDLIKKVDTAYHSKSAGSLSVTRDSSYKCIPLIHEQLQDWEDGLCESEADGSFLHENWNQDLRLFSDGEDGGHQLLQLLILRAESEIHAISGDSLTQNLHTLDSLRAQMGCFFGSAIGKPKSVTPLDVRQSQHTCDAIFKPRVGNKTVGKYNGDWMKRPISDGEIAWMARLLISFSELLNERLGLNQGQSNQASPSVSYVDVSDGEVSKEGGLKEAVRMVLCSIGSWLLLWAMAVASFMRQHGLRVNLRFLASKKVVIILLVSSVFNALRKAFGVHSLSSVLCLAFA